MIFHGANDDVEISLSIRKIIFGLCCLIWLDLQQTMTHNTVLVYQYDSFSFFGKVFLNFFLIQHNLSRKKIILRQFIIFFIYYTFYLIQIICCTSKKNQCVNMWLLDRYDKLEIWKQTKAFWRQLKCFIENLDAGAFSIFILFWAMFLFYYFIISQLKNMSKVVLRLAHGCRCVE